MTAPTTPSSGFTFVDKREQKRAEKKQRVQGQTEFARQAAGALFWEAEYAASCGRHDLAELTLTKRTELLDGARQHLGEQAVAGLT